MAPSQHYATTNLYFVDGKYLNKVKHHKTKYVSVYILYETMLKSFLIDPLPNILRNDQTLGFIYFKISCPYMKWMLKLVFG